MATTQKNNQDAASEFVINFKTLFLFLVLADLGFLTLSDDYHFTLFRTVLLIFFSSFNAVVLLLIDLHVTPAYKWSFAPTLLIALTSFFLTIPDQDALISIFVICSFALSNLLRWRRLERVQKSM